MAHTINVRLTVTVDDGPQVTTSRTLQLHAYDKLDVTIPADGNPHAVEVQPDDGTQVRLLVLTASSYDPSVAWAADSGTSRQLDQPVSLAGESVASLLGTAGNTIAFTNGGGDDLDVQILVGRQATS